MADNKEKSLIEPLKATAPIDRIIPKYCTTVNFGVTNEKQFIMTFVFQEGDQTVIIDRIAITHEHAKNVSQVLTDLLEGLEENGSTDKPKTTKK